MSDVPMRQRRVPTAVRRSGRGRQTSFQCTVRSTSQLFTVKHKIADLWGVPILSHACNTLFSSRRNLLDVGLALAVAERGAE